MLLFVVPPQFFQISPPCGMGLVSSFWTRMKGFLGFCLYCCFYSYEHLKAVCVWTCGCMDVFEIYFSWTYCQVWSWMYSMCLVGVHSVCAGCMLIARMVHLFVGVWSQMARPPQHTSRPNARPPPALDARPILTEEVWVYVCLLPSKHESCLPPGGFILFSSPLFSSVLFSSLLMVSSLMLDLMRWAMSWPSLSLDLHFVLSLCRCGRNCGNRAAKWARGPTPVISVRQSDSAIKESTAVTNLHQLKTAVLDT